eukprot:13506495-Ditylum_brightwellii.AAC.1
MDEMLLASNAPLEQLFNDCTFCGELCQCKKQLAEQQDGEYTYAGKQMKMLYRSKKEDPELYKVMKEAYNIFQRKEMLEQSHHPYNTQNMKV